LYFCEVCSVFFDFFLFEFVIFLLSVFACVDVFAV